MNIFFGKHYFPENDDLGSEVNNNVMTSIDGNVDTSTIAAGTIQSNVETTKCIMFLVSIAPMIFLILLMLSEKAYVHIKSLRKGPTNLTPVIPFPQYNLQVFKGTDDLKNVVPEAKIQVCNEETKKPAILLRFLRRVEGRRKFAIYEPLNEFMASTFKLHTRLPHEYQEVPNETGERLYRIKSKRSVPNNARTISIKMDGFEHGEKCHDFVPIRGAAPGSHYTYQMYGDNRIQVTRYVLNGFSDIAGFCIYIEDPWLSRTNYNWTLLNHMAKSAITSTEPEIAGETRKETNQPKIEVIPEEKTNLISDESDDREWTGKYCLKLRRKVMTSMDSGEVVLHQEWSDRNNQMRIEKCEECTKELLEKEEQPPTYSSMFVV